LIEAAQPNLDLATLESLGDETVIFGVVSMGDREAETSQTVAARIRAALRWMVQVEIAVLSMTCLRLARSGCRPPRAKVSGRPAARKSPSRSSFPGSD
jgi:hypothetical protein